jgi:hypothetical protein
MIEISKVHKNLLSDGEILDNIAEYIRNNVGSQDWSDHVSDISGYVAAGIQWTDKEVEGYLLTKLAQKQK